MIVYTMYSMGIRIAVERFSDTVGGVAIDVCFMSLVINGFETEDSR